MRPRALSTPTYLCQKQTLRSSTIYSAKHTHTHTHTHTQMNTQVGSHGIVSPRLSGLSCVCYHHFDQNSRTCKIIDLWNGMWNFVGCNKRIDEIWCLHLTICSKVLHEKLIWWQQCTLKDVTKYYTASHLRTQWWKPHKQMFLSCDSLSVQCEVRKSLR